MSVRTIFIEPSDVWLFRDARPFAAGEQGRAVSIFPPTPRTIQGAIRSARIAASGASFADPKSWPEDVGTPNDFGSLRLRGPLLARRDASGAVRPLFPLPSDVMKSREGWRRLKPDDSRGVSANWGASLHPLLPEPGGEPEKYEAGWLTDEGLRAYLAGGDFSGKILKAGELYERESRFGVQIDTGVKRPVEGMLYQVEFVRVREGVGLLVEVGGVPLPPRGLLQLGGEARAARYETTENTLGFGREGHALGADPTRRFKLYFATPALFHNGWLPAAISVGLAGRWRGVDLKLVAAAVGRPQAIGGRDISQKDRQRAIRRAVPSGSVYFFESGASAGELFDAFDGKCVSDDNAEAEIGFGLCYVGGW